MQFREEIPLAPEALKWEKNLCSFRDGKFGEGHPVEFSQETDLPIPTGLPLSDFVM